MKDEDDTLSKRAGFISYCCSNAQAMWYSNDLFKNDEDASEEDEEEDESDDDEDEDDDDENEFEGGDQDSGNKEILLRFMKKILKKLSE